MGFAAFGFLTLAGGSFPVVLFLPKHIVGVACLLADCFEL